MKPDSQKAIELRTVSKMALAFALSGSVVLGVLIYSQVDAKPVSDAIDLQTTPRLPNGAPLSFSQLVETVSPAVVSVQVTGENAGQALDQNQRPRRDRGFTASQGSGFVIDPSGFIVTNHHVISNGSVVKIQFADGKTLPARVVGEDPQTDLALLKVEADDPLPYVTFADSDGVDVGDWVVAVGNPFGLGGTVTTGIVSALGRDIGSGPYADYIQIDAAINSGNSGGPSFNLQGEVVGVNTAIVSPSGGSVGIGFAISAETTSDIIADLKDAGAVKRGWLGVGIQAMEQDLALALGLDEAEGAIVTNVFPNGPAADAGLEVGDVILRVDGNDVRSMRDVTRLIADLSVGQEASFEVYRDGERRTLRARIGERGEAMRLSARPSESKTAMSGLGLQLAPLNRSTARRLGLDPDQQGVLVSEVDPVGEAARKGLRPGDIILQVDGRPVDDPKAAIDEFERAQASNTKAVSVLVQRGENQSFVAFKLS